MRLGRSPALELDLADAKVQDAAKPVGALLPTGLDCVHVHIFVGGIVGKIEGNNVKPCGSEVLEGAVSELGQPEGAGVVVGQVQQFLGSCTRLMLTIRERKEQRRHEEVKRK